MEDSLCPENLPPQTRLSTRFKGRYKIQNPPAPAQRFQSSRWYDNDPVIPRALEQLRQASSPQQAQIALNIIKVILEHQLEAQQTLTADSLEASVDRYLLQAARQRYTQDESELMNRRIRRWYDTSQTLHAAINLLQDCPEDLKQSVIPTLATMIEDALDRHGELVG